MDTTPNLKPPYLLPSQAQKHVTVNEGLRSLDATQQLGVISRNLATVPSSPNDGDRYIVAQGAGGDWLGEDNNIAAWQDNAWHFYAPKNGWLAFAIDEASLLVWHEQGWQIPAASVPEDLTELGVNANPDQTNRLSIASDASLFSHDGDDHRLVVNKAAQGDTASVVFQTAFSGRAEFGLAGNDDWQVKVSPDGTNWLEALSIDAQSGKVTLANTQTREALSADRTYYVRPDGNDSNKGLGDSAGSAFATIQRACNAVAVIDLVGFAVTISVAPGTYSETITLSSYVGKGPVSLIGDPNDPSQVLIDAAGVCIAGDGVLGAFHVEGFKLRSTSYCLYMNAGSICTFTKLHFDGAGTHLYARAGGTLQAINSGVYEITATSFQQHVWANLPGASVTVYGNTITLPAGGATCTTQFASAKRANAINMNACTFVNKSGVTGKRYSVQENAIVSTGGVADFLPGDVAGDTLTGGIYG